MATLESPQTGPKRLFLLDTMALAYRAFYAFFSNPRINSDGANTSPVYGFTTTLLHLIREYSLEYCAIVLDKSGKTFRNDLYADYKANRKPMPEAIAANLPLIRQIARSLSIPVVERSGFEADDVIGTLARKAEAAGAQVSIVSSDKDFNQLLSERIQILKPGRGSQPFAVITQKDFEQKYGLSPGQFIDVLALCGDSSDNVPGARGIGEKTAITLLKQYETLENTLANADNIRYKRPREGLKANPDLVRLSKDLVTIRTDLDVPLSWEDLRRGPIHAREVLRTFASLEFTTLTSRLRNETDPVYGSEPESESEVATEYGTYDPDLISYRTIDSKVALVQLERNARRFKQLALYAVFTEGTPIESEWLGLAVSWLKNAAWYIPIPMPDGTPAAVVLRILAPLMANPNLEKVGHGLKPWLMKLRRENVQFEGPVFDTEVAHYLLSPDQTHQLPAVTRQYLHYAATSWIELIGTGRGKKTIRSIEGDAVRVLACERADCALKLRDKLDGDLKGKGLYRIAAEMEFPLVGILAHMEANGVLMDVEVLNGIEPQLEEEISNLEREIHELAGGPFNIGSSKQVAEVLFDRLRLPAREKSASGRRSTREEVLLRLVTDHDAAIAGLIVDWRKATRLKSTNIDGLRKYARPDTSRVHTVFSQTTAATGRLASSDPALQNIPVRQATGRNLRSAFVAPAGWLLLSADYSQIELRILAHMSADEGLINIFASGRDPHTETAARIYGIPGVEVSRSQRSRAKAVNYGIPYGLSATNLARQLRCSRQEAGELMRIYHQSLPGIRPFLKQQVQKARDSGYAMTLWGRRRYLPDLNSRNSMVRAAAERIAINMPIQGTQADMIKAASVAIDGRLKHEGLRTRAVLQVHDELVFEVPEYETDRAREIVFEAMTSALTLSVPVEVEIHLGANWLEVH
ncbi:MAG: DNA polymerase I [Bacteroidota bacterium]|nr:DNA polymerase I [Bacteroidota bacterium]